MPSPKTMEIICFLCAILQGFAAAAYIGTLLIPWLRSKRVNPFIVTRPLILLILTLGCLLFAVAGFWFVFHPLQVNSSSTQLPALKVPLPSPANDAPLSPKLKLSGSHRAPYAKPVSPSPAPVPAPAPQIAPVTTISAPNGIAIGGEATAINPTVNNYPEKVPEIEGVELVSASSTGIDLPDFSRRENPTTTYKFYLDRAWDDAKIAIICDRPCHGIDIRPARQQRLQIPNYHDARSLDPKFAGFLPDFVLKGTTYYLITIQSEDKEPVRIVQIGRLQLPDKPI